jgi:hypothetical protein
VVNKRLREAFGHLRGVLEARKTERNRKPERSGGIEGDPRGKATNLIAGSLNQQTIGAKAPLHQGPSGWHLIFAVLAQHIEGANQVGFGSGTKISRKGSLEAAKCESEGVGGYRQAALHSLALNLDANQSGVGIHGNAASKQLHRSDWAGSISKVYNDGGGHLAKGGQRAQVTVYAA